MSALVLLVQLAVAQPTPLEAALQQELAVLRAEQSNLQKAYDEADKNRKIAKRALEAELAALTAELVKRRAENADAAQHLPESERLHAAEDQQRQLDQLEEQLRVAAKADPDTPVEDVFAELVKRLDNELVATVAPRQWFGADGKAKTSPVLTIGRVAAVTWDEAALALVSLPSGDWWSVPDQTARSPQRLSQATVVDVVLFDPRQPPDRNGFHTHGFRQWVAGGGFTMWPLLLLGAIAVFLAIGRFVGLLGANSAVSRFGAAPRAEVALPWLARVQSAATAGEIALLDALDAARQALFRGLSFLSLAAGVAPLLGLLGTVTGMIGTFDVITEHGTGDPQLLSGGISEALITTQLGLIVAVVALLLQAVLRRMALNTLGRLERMVMDLVRQESE